MSDPIKQQVYELLWELFGDDCPFLIKSANQIESLMENYTEEEWESNPKGIKINFCTILFEILPAKIIIDKKIYHEYFQKDVIWGIIKGKQLIIIDYVNPESELFELDYSNIWQAILSLLEAIKNYPEKDKMKFKWGE